MTNKSLHILYFASLAEQAGRDEERLTISDTATLGDIYQSLKDKYGFDLAQHQLAVAINHHIGHWQSFTQDGDTIAFIPPVAGG